MVEKCVYIFGIPENINDTNIVEKFHDLLKHRVVKSINKVTNGDGQIIRLTFDDLDEKGIKPTFIGFMEINLR